MRRRVRYFWIALLGLSMFAVADRAPCQSGSAEVLQSGKAAERRLRYQRVFVPADNPESWPRDAGERYLRMPAAEFEHRVRQLQGGAANSTGADPRLERAAYSAELSEEGMLVGTGVWTFELEGDKTGVAVLPECKLQLRQARWREDPSRAVVGNDRQGRLSVVVERSGQLQFSWSLRPNRNFDGERAFSLPLARGLVTTLMLELKDGLTPIVDRGLVIEEATTKEGRRRWRLELGSDVPEVLRLVERWNSPSASRSSATLSYQTLRYRISPRGLTVEADLRLDFLGPPARRIAVRLDPPLEALSARVGAREISMGPAQVLDDGTTRMLIDLPEAYSSTRNEIRLTASAPWDLGKRSRLPLVAVEDARWQSGEARVDIVAPLAMEELLLEGCHQSGFTAPDSSDAQIGDPETGEVGDGANTTVRLQFFDPAPNIKMTVGRPESRLQMRGLMSVLLRPTEASGKFYAKLSVAHGEKFAFEAQVSPHWLIDSVEAARAGTIADWTYQPVRGRAGKLRIQLSRPVTPERGATLVISGRRQRPSLNTVLRTDDLMMLTTQHAESVSQLLHVDAAETYELDLSGAHIAQRVDLQSNEVADAGLADGLENGLMFVHDERTADMTVALVPRPPRFAAEVRGRAVVEDNTLREIYDFAIEPEGRDLSQLVVRFSQPRDEPVHWSWIDEGGVELAAQRLSAAELAAVGFRDGEAWAVTLPGPQNGPFRIRAQRQLPFRTDTPVALASVIDAQTQRGSMTIASQGQTRPVVRTGRLKAIQAFPAVGQGAVLAAFRYDPEADTLLTSDPPLVLGPSDALSATPRGWIWQARLHSQYRRSEARHGLSCYVENTGRDHITFTFPKSAQLREVLLDGRPVANTAPPGSAMCQVVLPNGRRFVMLELRWTDAVALPRTAASFSAPWPECDVPVLDRDWLVRLPPDWTVGDASVPGVFARAPWPRRLFGPLWPAENAQPFSPFSWHDWRSLFDPDYETRTAVELARQIRARLLAMADDRAASAAATWGELLLSAAASANANEISRNLDVLIDNAAFREWHIEARTPLRTEPTSGDGFNPAGLAQRLESVAFLIHPDAVVVTTPEGIARFRAGQPDETIGGAPPVYLAQRNTPLRDEISAAARDQQSVRLVALEQWAVAAAGARHPWRIARMPSVGTDNRPPLRMSGVGVDGAIVVVNRFAFTVVAWGVFLLVAATRWWAGPLRGSTDLILFLGVTAVAILVPVWLVPFGSAAWLGFIVGRVLVVLQSRWPRANGRQPLPETRSSDRSGSISRRLVGATAIALALWSVWQHAAAAQETARDNDQDVVYRVLVPTDENQRPAGDYYLHEQFFHALVEATSKRDQAPPEYLITAASYRPENPTAANDMWACEYEVETLRPDTLVQLPLGADGATLATDGVMVDGKAAPVRWNDRRECLEVRLSRGTHRLSIRLRPKIDAAGIDFAIPPVTASTVRLPEGFILATSGESRASDDANGPDQVEVGAANRLTIHRDSAEASNSDRRGGQFDVEQLCWLRIRQNTVTMDARLKLSVRSGTVRKLSLRIDPRLHPLQMAAGGNASQFTVSPHDPRLLEISLNEPTADEAIVNLAFLVQDARGVGRIDAPVVEVVGANNDPVYWAVSGDSLTEIEMLGNDHIRSIAAEEFVAMWGGSDAKPKFAMQLFDFADWSVAVRPARSVQRARYLLGVSLGITSAEIRAAIQIRNDGESAYSQRVRVPPGLEISEVALYQQGREVAVNWARSHSDAINVFFDSPETETTLLLRGRAAYGKDAVFALPQIELVGAEPAGFRAVVLRTAPVLVESRELKGAEFAPNETWEGAVDEARHAGLFDDRETSAQQAVAVVRGNQSIRPSRFEVRPNRPEISASQLTMMNRTSEGWLATLAFQVNVENGVADSLQFELPANLTGPFELSPALPFFLEELPGENRRRLVVRHRPPLTGEGSLQITAAVNPAAGQRPSAPDVRLLGANNVSRYFLLPREDAGQLLSWDVRGLIATKQMPSEFAHLAPDAERNRLYQLTSDQFRAAFRSIDRAPTNAQVRLVDIVMGWQSDGSCAGVTTFDLEPGSSSTCMLALPEAFQLIDARLDGMPAQLSATGAGRWDVWLGQSKLPRRLEVVFQGTLNVGSGFPWQIVAPQLVDVDVERTLWTVAAPRSAGYAVLDDRDRLSRLRHEQFRIDEAAAIVDSSASLLLEEPTEDVAAWNAAWSKRLMVSRETIHRLRALVPQDPAAQEVMFRIEAVERDHLQLARRLDTVDQWNQLSQSRPEADSPLRTWLSLEPSIRSSLFSMTLGGNNLLEVSYPNWKSGGIWPRVAWLLLLGSLVAIGTWIYCRLGHNLPAPDVQAFPHWKLVVGVALGFAWWFWLSPSIVGLAIVAVSAALVYLRRPRTAVAAGSSARLPSATTAASDSASRW